MSYRVGICDKDSNYAVGLMEYINMHANIPLKAYVFSSWKASQEYIERGELDVIVLGKEVIVECCDVPIVYITDDKDESLAKNYIYKYQNVDEIARQITASIRKAKEGGKNEHRIYGVYSPIGRSGKTRVAMGLCNFYRNSLYIGWEDYPTHNNGDDASNVAEKFLYYILGRNTDIIKLVKERHGKMGNFDIIVGGISCMDIRQVSVDDMIWLVNLLKEHTEYKTIVFDIGIGALESVKILSVMDKIITPILNDEISIDKLNSFKRILKCDADTDIDRILTYILVPDGEYNEKPINDMLEGGLLGSE